MRKRTIDVYLREFDYYFKSKKISPSISKKFLSSLYSHIEENEKSFKCFWEFIKSVRGISVDKALKRLNSFLVNKRIGFKTVYFICDWSHSYLGPGELMLLILFNKTHTGGKRNPDILFNNSSRRIEVKSYAESFRLTESTSFFTDLGTIIQALVQGGFLHSLTDANNNDLKKGLRHFCESFLCPRGYIELNNKTWKLESSSNERIIFKISPGTPKEYVNYSVVRNSLRNWLGRGMLSIKLAKIIDPTRTTKIKKREVYEYVNNLIGSGDLAPIPLEQYFILCGIESMIIYENKNKKTPFQLIGFDDLKLFTLDRIGQAKVSYKRKLIIKSRKKS